MKIKVKAISIRRCSRRPPILFQRHPLCCIRGDARRADVVKGKAVPRRNQMRGCSPVCLACLPSGFNHTLPNLLPHKVIWEQGGSLKPSAVPCPCRADTHMVCSQPVPVPLSTATVINVYSGANQHCILHTYSLNLSKLTERWSLWGLINCSSEKGYFD